MILENNLVQRCVCGNTEKFTQKNVNTLDVLECQVCGVMHQYLSNFSYDDYLGFYQYQYHDLYQEKKGILPYRERYEHDCKVADMRLKSYGDLMQKGMKVLDIGSSNSAFVHRARNKGIDCIGLEPGDSVGDDAVTIRGTILTVTLEQENYDVVTMHDSIEHMVDVHKEMIEINKVLKPNGTLIVDLPDYFDTAGKHHWKKVEHLWLFDRQDMINFLFSVGFKVFRIDTPIPGKFVFFAGKI